MPSPKNPLAKSAALLNATARTRSVIESLQARLMADARGWVSEQASAPPPVEPVQVSHEESVDDLERQLQAYFDSAAPTSSSSRTKVLNELRNRVIDGVVDRILVEWATPRPGASPGAGFGPEVMERLVERVLEEFRKVAEPSKTSGLE